MYSESAKFSSVFFSVLVRVMDCMYNKLDEGSIKARLCACMYLSDEPMSLISLLNVFVLWMQINRPAQQL